MKKFEVGENVVLLKTGNLVPRYETDLTNYDPFDYGVVEKIGRKLIHVRIDRYIEKFEYNAGRGEWRQKTDVCCNYILYHDKEDYYESRHKENIMREFTKLNYDIIKDIPLKELESMLKRLKGE